MKVSLIVASGTHQGKAIPINRPEFLIGREGSCQLRPASQAISKKHCGILIREGKVFIVDYASTNGTLVNDVLLKNEEAELQNGARVSIGALDFTVRIELDQGVADGTPFPATAPEALAAVKAVSGAAPEGKNRDSTPNPSIKPQGLFGSKEPAVLTDSKEQAAVKPSGGSKPAMKPMPTPAKPAAAPPPPLPKRDTKISASAPPPEVDSDDIAAMLLGMDDDEEVSGGSTVMEAPSLLNSPPPTGATTKLEDKTPKKATSREEMTNAAADPLRKMARRPK